MAKKTHKVDPLLAKADKKRNMAINKSRNYIGNYHIHSVYGKGKNKVTVIDKQDVAVKDGKDFNYWTNFYNVHVYTDKPVVMSHAIGQAKVIKKNIVYIKHGIPKEITETITQIVS